MRIEVTGPLEQTSAQRGLFEPVEDSVSQKPSKAGSPCSSGVPSHVEDAREPRQGHEARTWRAVFPLASMTLGNVCGFCGLDVRPPGFVILDYEELGVFCNQECADRRFRLYLDDGTDEDESASA